MGTPTPLLFAVFMWFLSGALTMSFFFGTVSAFVRPKLGDACLVLGGDLDFPAVVEGRLNVNAGRVSLTDEGVSAHVGSTFVELCEIFH